MSEFTAATLLFILASPHRFCDFLSLAQVVGRAPGCVIEMAIAGLGHRLASAVALHALAKAEQYRFVECIRSAEADLSN